jgi:SLOG in TRPM, prokaryote
MPQEIQKESILFAKNKRATAVLPAADTDVTQIVAALGLKKYDAVILILGGAEGVDEKLRQRLIQLFGRGIARAAANANAVIIECHDHLGNC